MSRSIALRRPSLLTIAALVMVLLITFAPFLYILLTGDFPGAASTYGIEEDSPIVGALLSLSPNAR